MKCPFPLILRHVAVQRKSSRPGGPLHHSGHSVAAGLGVGKHQHPLIGVIPQHLTQLLVSFIGRTHRDVLLNVVIGHQLGAANGEKGVIRSQVPVHQRLHLVRPAGGEHHRLSFFRALVDEVGDLRLKAHVQHAVGLVDNYKKEN